MKLNLKVRAKNAAFWITFVPTAVGFIYSTLSLLGVVPRVSEDAVVHTAMEVVSLLATVGVLTDPTTSGLSDSDRAMTYDEPH